MACKSAKANGKVDNYKRLFKEFDKNGDGFLNIQEFRELLRRGGSNMSDGQIAEVFVFFDSPEGDRRITFEEFAKGLDQILSFMAKLGELFSQLDADGSGFLDKKELTTLLKKSGTDYSDSDITTILQRADKNCDNKISFEEFVDACC